MGNEIKDTINDARDAVKEGVHRGKADVERERRADHGEIMSPGEKAGSMAREASEEAKAEFDRAKRDVRDAT